jgi:predicted hydrolase (HD superfamily)
MLLSHTQAINLLHQYVKNEKMIFHCLASEAVLRGLALRLGEDEPTVHGTQTEVLLKGYDVDDDILDAIRMHNEVSAGKERNTKFQHALAAGETITGLIFATTYVYPDRKLTSVKPKSVVKRMKEKMFAASVKRENILECEMIGIPIEEFAALSIQAMMPIAGSIGL